MDAVTYGWLSNCAIAPTVGAITVWILFMFNIYRSEWRNVDIFLVLITLQQLLSSSSIFAYSVVNIIRSRNETSCNLTVWSLTTLRVFQLSTIASLAVDRALTLKWPYKYRFSVRSNQIAYHIVVLALMSGLVGVAGVFARLSPSDYIKPSTTSTSTASTLTTLSLPTTVTTPSTPNGFMSTASSFNGTYISSTPSSSQVINSFNHNQVCSLNPLAWDIRFNLFLTCLCGLITLITLSSFVYIECNRSCESSRSIPKSKMLPNSRISSYGDLAIDNLGSTEAITKYHLSGLGVGGGPSLTGGGGGVGGSHNSLQRFYSISKEDSNKHSNIMNHLRLSDLRWAVVVAITSLSYAVNQGPSLIFMFVGMMIPHFWTPLHDNVITWFALIEGLLLPFSIYLTDDNFRDAVKLSFRRHRSCSQEKYKPSPGMINKPGFTFHYNDFVMIDKPYLGLMKSSEPKRSPSTLNLVTNSRSPHSGRHFGSDQQGTPKDRGNLKCLNVNDVSGLKTGLAPGNGLFGSSNKAHVVRNNSQLSYIMTPGLCKKQQSGLSFDAKGLPFFANSSTLISNLTKSDDSIRKEKIPSSLARLSPMAWSVNGDNWHITSPTNKIGSIESHDPKVGDNDDDIDIVEDEHIYATLKVRSTGDSASEYESKLETNQNGGVGGQRREPGLDDNSVSGISFTTNANDDFEFHDTRNVSNVDVAGVATRSYSKFGEIENGMIKVKPNDDESSSSGEDTSIMTSESCSTSDSESDNHHHSNLHHHSHSHLQLPHPQLHQLHHHHSQLQLSTVKESGNHYKTGNLIMANPMVNREASSRSKSRLPSHIPIKKEEKRRGWQFFSASDIHLLDSRNQEIVSMKQDIYHHLNQLKRPFDESPSISNRRTMSETNLAPRSSYQPQQQQSQQQLAYFPRENGLYHLSRPTHNRIHLPFDNHHHHHQQQYHHHDTNTSNSTNSSGTGGGDSSSGGGIGGLGSSGSGLGFGDKSILVFGDRRLNRISSFSKNRPRIRAQKYQIHRRAARRQESIKELSVDYRRNCVGSRLSLTQQDLVGSKELGAFVSVKSMPDLTINSYLPIYNQLSPMK